MPTSRTVTDIRRPDQQGARIEDAKLTINDGLAMNQLINKHLFLSGDTCRTQGWYALRAPDEAPTPGREWRFFVGTEIGRIARRQLGTGVTLPMSPVETALNATKTALGSPDTALAFEPTFTMHGLIARADATRQNGDAWDLIEVKSGKLPSDRNPDDVKSDYVEDIAFTASVAQAAGLKIARCILMLIKPEYRHGMPATELLGEIDVTARALPRAQQFAGIAAQVVRALLSAHRPNPVLNVACKTCEFYATECIGVGIPDPIFALPGLRGKRFERLQPYGRITALPEDADLTEAQRRVATAFRTGKPLIEPGIDYIDGITSPTYYLDFEGVGPAIPWFPDDEPYDQIPFQFSIHACDVPGHVTTHFEHIAPIEGDWRRDLASQLLANLGERGSILMYTPYERRMIKYLAKALPDLDAALLALVPRLFDLEPVFKDGYCDAGFRGRTSIKETLPTLVKGLGYDKLAVRNGSDAAALFALTRVGYYPAADWVRHRENLLQYCELDTFAMVRLHQELHRIRATLPKP